MNRPHTTLCIALMTLVSCNSMKPIVTDAALDQATPFVMEQPRKSAIFAGPDRIEQLSAQEPNAYLLGPGDVLDITVWNRPEISRKGVVVAPDGSISVPRVGVLNINRVSIGQAAEAITTRLKQNYEHPEVTISVKTFNNNKAFVLGRVSKPGVVSFPGEGTLLEALALAGGLPFIGKETYLTRCAVIRGKDTVFWIDLRELLDRGNMALNARILNNDVIFIPEAEDEMVLVLGEVAAPGPVQLKRGLNLIDAVARSGGFNRKANLKKVFVIRPAGETAHITEVNLKEALEQGTMSVNYKLEKNDVVYVPPTGMTRFNYALEQLMPSLRVLSITTNVADTLGLTDRVINLGDTQGDNHDQN